MKATTEKAFEAYIQETMAARGWFSGSNQSWDKKSALFPDQVIAFIKETQADLWAQMKKHHGTELSGKLIETLVKERDSKGTLHIIRHGFKFYRKTFRLAYFKPAHGLVQETLELFSKNSLQATRQVACHPGDASTVDMVLSLNGIPLATMELKNPATGQTWKHAVAQYKSDRDPRAPLFQFIKGAVVHFAVDPDEVYMATRLNKEKTFFLPFNRGSAPGEIECGKGNPQHPSGHRTGYFWEDVLERTSFLDIVGSFIFLETSEETVDDGAGGRKKLTRETMVFPRYHQLDAVRSLVRNARTEQAGNHYLIQHSAGSGKTNSISWLSHRLSSLHTSADEKIFDCVVVITDRRVLDKQLQDAIYQIEHAQGVVKAIDENSSELKRILGAGTDQGTEESELDWEDGLNKVMESRGRQKNLSFFAFTATPKGKTLELFGRKGVSGKPEAFHTYSMKQAIEEGFILDVLKHYTTYKTYFKLVKRVEDDPAMPKKKAQKKLGKFMALHPHNIEQKTEIMVEHFRGHVKRKLGGRAKAMVVTGSRFHAVRYMLSFQKYIQENHYKAIRTAGSTHWVKGGRFFGRATKKVLLTG